MKQLLAFLQITIPVLLISFAITGCSAIEGIFKAGVWTGILFVVGIVALVIFIIVRLGKRN